MSGNLVSSRYFCADEAEQGFWWSVKRFHRQIHTRCVLCTTVDSEHYSKWASVIWPRPIHQTPLRKKSDGAKGTVHLANSRWCCWWLILWKKWRNEQREQHQYCKYLLRSKFDLKIIYIRYFQWERRKINVTFEDLLCDTKRRPSERVLVNHKVLTKTATRGSIWCHKSCG